MIKAKILCYCGHLQEKHIAGQVWSRAAQGMVFADVCATPWCKCKHFEKTTFVPETKEFKEAETLHKIKDEQMELFDEKVISGHIH